MLFLGTCLSQSFATENDYEIGPGDVLEIKVYDHPDLDTVSRVNYDGHILFPLAGQIKVGSLTTASASKAIADKLDGEYIINPQVSIFVQEFRSKKVMVIGEVVRRFDAQVLLKKDDHEDANGTDIVQMLSLGAVSGDRISLEASGPDTTQLLDALERLFAANFDAAEENTEEAKNPP